MRLKIALTSLISFWMASLAAPALALDSIAIVESIQKQYDATETFEARFVQKSFMKILGQTQTAKGTVFIRKPGKMKWEYNAPDPQVLVSNDQGLWLYLPEERQVTKMKVESVYSSNTPALFLAGKGKLTQSFNIGKVTEKDGIYRAELIPRDKLQNLSKMILLANKNNFQIVGSQVYDNLGNQTEMIFHDIKVNPVLKESLFHFEVPRGVEFIDLSAME